MRCAKCHRALKNASRSGYGPVCERAVLGSKPKRARIITGSRKVRADERQAELALEMRT